jgi:hypothetical protein
MRPAVPVRKRPRPADGLPSKLRKRSASRADSASSEPLTRQARVPPAPAKQTWNADLESRVAAPPPVKAGHGDFVKGRARSPRRERANWRVPHHQLSAPS